MPGKLDAFLSPGTLRGLKYIFVDEWGPYDFAGVKLVPESTIFWNEAELRGIGARGEVRNQGHRGGRRGDAAWGDAASRARGRLAGPQTARVFVHGRTARARGKPAGARDIVVRRLGREVLRLEAGWGAEAAGRLGRGSGRSGTGRKETRETRFRLGRRAPSDKVPADHFATVSTTELELPAGRYELRTVSDDGVRVSIDGRLVIDNWTWHPPMQDKAEVELKRARTRFESNTSRSTAWPSYSSGWHRGRRAFAPCRRSLDGRNHASNCK